MSRVGGLIVLGVLGALVSCSPGSTASGPTVEDPFGVGGQCTAYRPPTEPDLMGWDTGSRAKLKRLKHQGVVAVRYNAQGCNVELEVLEGCIAKDKKYTYEPYSGSETKIARNSKELFAQLPIGAATLGGRMKGGKAIRTDYMLAGMEALAADVSISESDLKGNECSRATHVVRAVYLGGFAMVAGASTEIEAGASVFGIGAGGGEKSSVERMT